MGHEVIEVIDISRGEPDQGVDLGLDGEARTIISGDPEASIIPLRPSDTLHQLVDFIVDTVRVRGRIRLLRIHGHGSPGWFLHGLLTTDTVQEPRDRRQLARVRHCFDRRMVCEADLMGCSVAGGEDGRQLLTALADLWRVPVAAGVGVQRGGNRSTTYTFEGAVWMAYPRDGNRPRWVRMQ
jgi:hypothetical protein